ncbi:MAG: hypothetical protein IJA20_05095 [Methanocorpusculum sp.]|nr:hypothetical protein [Methanocorpusculum sp.]
MGVMIYGVFVGIEVLGKKMTQRLKKRDSISHSSISILIRYSSIIRQIRRSQERNSRTGSSQRISKTLSEIFDFPT